MVSSVSLPSSTTLIPHKLNSYLLNTLGKIVLTILCGRLFKVKFTSKAGENFLIWSNRLIYFIAKIEVFNGIFAVLTDPFEQARRFCQGEKLA